MRLALTQQAWVHRRIETFEFVDAVTVRRRMSVDYELPPDIRLGAQPGAPLAFIPVMLLDKANLRNFNMTDEEGTSRNALTASQNGDIASRGMYRLLSAEFRPHERSNPNYRRRVRDRIDGVVKESDPATALQLAEATLEENGTLGTLIGRQLPANADNIRALILQLASGFLLLTPLPYEAGRRGLLKISYDAAYRNPLREPQARNRYVIINRALSSLGLVGRTEDFPDLLIGLSESYHTEVVPPPDTYVAEAGFAVRRADGRKEPPSYDNHRFRPHLRATAASRSESGSLAVVIRANRETLLLPLLIAAAMVSGVLLVVPKRSCSVDAQTLAALLLVPFALAAYYARGAENSYVTRMLRGLRVIAGIPVAAGVAVIAILGLGYMSPHVATRATALSVATWCARASLWSTALLVCSFLTPLFGDVLQRPLRVAAARTHVWNHRARSFVTGAAGLLMACAILFAAVKVAIWLYHMPPSAPKSCRTSD